MTSITVYQPNATQRTTLVVDDKSYLEQALMDADAIQLVSVITNDDVSAYNSIAIRDYITFDSDNYYLNRPPKVERLKNNEYRYTFYFEGERYTLLNKLFLQPVSGDSKFYLTDDLSGILSTLSTNVAGYEAGWTFTTALSTARKTILFDGDSCRNVLNKLANEFDVEFYFEGKAVTFVETVGDEAKFDSLLSFQVGQNNGLYELKRLNVDKNNTITRAYLFGGTTNITNDYGKERLTLPAAYIEDTSEYSAIVEKAVVFEDVFPRFEGTVTAVDLVDGVNRKIHFDIDFDINDQLLSGVTAKVSFKTGDLTGRDFEMSVIGYNSQTQACEATIIQFTDDGDLTLPNDVMYPRAGDEFTLIDIQMPQSYIDAAHTELSAKGAAWLGYYKQLRVKYELTFDPRYLRDNAISFKLGDKIRIIDTSLGINKQIRITRLKVNIDNPNKVTAEISNILKESWEEDIQSRIQQTQDKVEIETSQKNYDINATRDWVGRNFAHLTIGNVFSNNQYFMDPLAGFDGSVVDWLQMITPSGFINAVAPMDEDTLVNNGVAVWDSANEYFRTTLNPIVQGVIATGHSELHSVEFMSWAYFYSTLEVDGSAEFYNGLNASGESQMQGLRIGSYLLLGDNSINQLNGALSIAAQDYINIIAGGFTHMRLYDDHITEYLTDENYWTGFLQSYLYSGDGFDGAGWKIHPSVNSESLLVVDNLVVRRALKAYEMEIDEITHVGGVIALSVAHGRVTSISGSNFYIDTNDGDNPIQFAVGDAVFAQKYTVNTSGSFRGRVTGVNQASGYITVSTLSGTPYEGMELVQMGNNTNTDRQAMVFINSITNPYMRLYGGMTDGTFTNHLLASFGYLGDINDATFGQLSGYGLYADNVYLTGTINAVDGKISEFSINAGSGEMSHGDDLGNGKIALSPLGHWFEVRGNSAEKILQISGAYNSADDTWGLVCPHLAAGTFSHPDDYSITDGSMVRNLQRVDHTPYEWNSNTDGTNINIRASLLIIKGFPPSFTISNPLDYPEITVYAYDNNITVNGISISQYTAKKLIQIQGRGFEPIN